MSINHAACCYTGMIFSISLQYGRSLLQIALYLVAILYGHSVAQSESPLRVGWGLPDIKLLSYKYRNSHYIYENKMIPWPSYVYNEITYICKMVFISGFIFLLLDCILSYWQALVLWAPSQLWRLCVYCWCLHFHGYCSANILAWCCGDIKALLALLTFVEECTSQWCIPLSNCQ